MAERNGSSILAYEPTSRFDGIDTERAPGFIRLRFGQRRRWNPGPPRIVQLDSLLLTIEGTPAGNNDESLPPFFAVPRADIYVIKFVKHSGQLVIHAHGHEMIEVRPIDDSLALEWVAEQLRQVLGEALSPDVAALDTAQRWIVARAEVEQRKGAYRNQVTCSTKILRIIADFVRPPSPGPLVALAVAGMLGFVIFMIAVWLTR